MMLVSVAKQDKDLFKLDSHQAHSEQGSNLVRESFSTMATVELASRPGDAQTAQPLLLRLPSDDHVNDLATSFAQATPYPFITFDDVLTVSPDDIQRSFPDKDWPHWNLLGEAYQRNKRSADRIEKFPPLLKQLTHELSTPTFLTFLQKLTGISGLLPDSFLNGGGLHLSGPGGLLMPHVDFHRLKEFALFRRINVLIYLNTEWEADWGGCLKLYEKGKKDPARTIVPAFGRMVVFRTDGSSVHGFPDPVTDGHWRKSLALYYYTSQEASTWSGDGNTYWQQHEQVGTSGKVGLAAYKGLLKASEKLSRLAHRFNPHTR